jgi:type IV fimbrial biogenesis protein FimT
MCSFLRRNFHAPDHAPGNQQGFTIIELMITVLVLAIIIAVAAPSFTRQIQNNRTSAITEEMTNLFSYARSEAVRRGSAVTVCASADGLSCGTNWNAGFMVFVDNVTTGSSTPDVDEVLQIWTEPDGRSQFTVSQSFVRYLGTGAVANGPTTFDIKFEGCEGDDAARQIVVGVSGLANVSRTACP